MPHKTLVSKVVPLHCRSIYHYVVCGYSSAKLFHQIFLYVPPRYNNSFPFFCYMLLSQTSLTHRCLLPQIILCLGQEKQSSSLKSYSTQPILPYTYCCIQLLLLVKAHIQLSALPCTNTVLNHNKFLLPKQYFLLTNFIFKSMCHFLSVNYHMQHTQRSIQLGEQLLVHFYHLNS